MLHIGCGSQPLPDWLSHFDEVRVDIDPETKPQFVRDMLDLHDIGTFDCVYSSHCLEHLYPYQVPKAMAEFMRVLNPGGAVFVVVPDLEDVKPDLTPILAVGETGKPMADWTGMCGLDLFYGLHTELEFHPHMAHHCGFIASVLQLVLTGAGFQHVTVERLENFNLAGSGRKYGLWPCKNCGRTTLNAECLNHIVPGFNAPAPDVLKVADGLPSAADLDAVCAERR